MRFRLRTLLIVLAIGPPVIAAAVWVYHNPATSAVIAIPLGAFIATMVFVRFARASINRVLFGPHDSQGGPT